jgi:hypothetical protein
VTVAKVSTTRTFTIHKSLLCNALKYFDSALNDGFEETTDSLTLPDDCPLAFEVRYQYLYSGQVKQHAVMVHGRRHLPGATMAACIQARRLPTVRPLQNIAYDRLKNIFSQEKHIRPTLEFVVELYDDIGPEHLQR